MRINIENDENIIASLPKIWKNEVGLRGFFSKSKEGFLVLTNKNLIFVPEWIFITVKDREKFFGGNEVKVSTIDGYTETKLDEDISEHSASVIIPLASIVEVESVKLRRSTYLRVRFKSENGKIKAYDFGVALAITNYPIRQPLQILALDWNPWVKVVRAYLS